MFYTCKRVQGVKIQSLLCDKCSPPPIEPDLVAYLSLKTAPFQLLSERLSLNMTQHAPSAKYNLGKYFLNIQKWRWESHWEPCEVSVVQCGTWHGFSVPAHGAARQLVGRQNLHECKHTHTHTQAREH